MVVTIASIAVAWGPAPSALAQQAAPLTIVDGGPLMAKEVAGTEEVLLLNPSSVAVDLTAVTVPPIDGVRVEVDPAQVPPGHHLVTVELLREDPSTASATPSHIEIRAVAEPDSTTTILPTVLDVRAVQEPFFNVARIAAGLTVVVYLLVMGVFGRALLWAAGRKQAIRLGGPFAAPGWDFENEWQKPASLLGVVGVAVIAASSLLPASTQFVSKSTYVAGALLATVLVAAGPVIYAALAKLAAPDDGPRHLHRPFELVAVKVDGRPWTRVEGAFPPAATPAGGATCYAFDEATGRIRFHDGAHSSAPGDRSQLTVVLRDKATGQTVNQRALVAYPEAAGPDGWTLPGFVVPLDAPPRVLQGTVGSFMVAVFVTLLGLAGQGLLGVLLAAEISAAQDVPTVLSWTLTGVAVLVLALAGWSVLRRTLEVMLSHGWRPASADEQTTHRKAADATISMGRLLRGEAAPGRLPLPIWKAAVWAANATMPQVLSNALLDRATAAAEQVTRLESADPAAADREPPAS